MESTKQEKVGEGILTEEKFDQLPRGEIFAAGLVMDGTDEFRMTNTREFLRWVAVKGWASDWSVYVGHSHISFEDVASNGDKVCTDRYIRLLVPCTDDVFQNYRF